ncbi:hypothetical protein FACS189437_08320 [Bacteroidia bacterium]|nr:hypothetical protein FACS189437_08320 [Bacteroidia bacterium]
MLSGLRYKHWTRLEAFTYFLKGIARELHIAPSFFLTCHEKVIVRTFRKNWLKRNGEESYFDFNGCKLPDISNSPENMLAFKMIFEDVLLFPCFFNDNYDQSIVRFMDQHMSEGPYGYTDGTFDVTVKKGDVVIDAGAWLGDFSAYATSKGAVAYAFEPVEETFRLLCKTAELNDGKIYPVQKGLGSSECKMNISIDGDISGANSLIAKGARSKEIQITTIDKFVEENKLKTVNFIKADIEGVEREMLRGASGVLKKFAPKLAICTYHLPDDPDVLEKIILNANPDYKIIHLRHKLFAAVT